MVVVGGGTAGLSVAARLGNTDVETAVTIIEPSDKHYYQPLWTLVGGGLFPKEVSERDMAGLIPEGVNWIKDAVAEFQPDDNVVVTAKGEKLAYDYLVVAPGIQINWSKVKGLEESLGRDGVCSNYSYATVNATWDTIRNFKGGTALFTFPATPIKCAGAPQKIMYLADDYFRSGGVRNSTRIAYRCGLGVIFSCKYYADVLHEVCKDRDIETSFMEDLVEIRAESKEAVFRNVDSGEETVEKYDMIHVGPPMSAPDFIRESPLGNPDGWVDVDQHSLQHVRYSNIFSLGDASSLPTSKTAAAIRSQAPVLVANLLAVMRGEKPPAAYNGYTSCPLVTGYGKLILAEFDYDFNPVETFPFDQRKERLSMYLLKKHVLPHVYWRALVRGRKWPWPIGESAPV
jgi:sulfide:quinone oxidoreductase